MSSTAVRRTAMVLPALALVAASGTAALASQRREPTRPAQRQQQATKTTKAPKAPKTSKKAKVQPQIGTAIVMVRNPDGTITVTER